MIDINLAKQLEDQHKWHEAAEIWRQAGCIKYAEACELIQNSIDKGDAFRATVTYCPHCNKPID